MLDVHFWPTPNGKKVTILLEELGTPYRIVPCDIGRGDQFEATLIWMHDEPMLPERPYLIRFATAAATAQVTDLSYRIDVNSLEKLASKTLALNEIGYCKLATDRKIAFRKASAVSMLPSVRVLMAAL